MATATRIDVDAPQRTSRATQRQDASDLAESSAPRAPVTSIAPGDRSAHDPATTAEAAARRSVAALPTAGAEPQTPSNKGIPAGGKAAAAGAAASTKRAQSEQQPVMGPKVEGPEVHTDLTTPEAIPTWARITGTVLGVLAIPGAGLLMATPLIMGITRLPWAGVLMLVGGVLTLGSAVLIHLMTLPTELDASFKRALPMLDEQKVLFEGDEQHARKLLRAAAMTYVAASMMSLLNIARWWAILRR